MIEKILQPKNIIVGICLVLLTALIAFYSPLNPLTGTGMTADQGVFFTVAKGLTQGKLAYVDYFDHKGPWLYFLLALGLRINEFFTGSISGNFSGNFLFEVQTIFLSVVFMYKIARIYADRFLSLVTVAGIFLCNIRLYTASNSEEYIFPLICISAWLFLLQVRDGICNQYAFLMGFFGMLTFFVKFNYCILWAVMGIAMFCMMVKQAAKDGRYKVGDILRMCAAFFAGMAVCGLPFVIYLVATKSFGAFIETYVIFSLDYAGMATMAKRLQTGLALLDVPIRIMLAGFLIATLGMTIGRADKKKCGLIWAWVLLSLTMFVTVASPGQPWTYYQQAALFIFIGAEAITWDALKEAGMWLLKKCRNCRENEKRMQAIRIAGGVLVLAVTAVLLRDQLTPGNFITGSDERQESILNVSSTIEQDREDGDTLISFADDCGMYFYTDCKPASRIIFPSASIIDPDLADELIGDLNKRPADYMTFTDGWEFGIPEKLTDWVDETLAADYELIYDDGLRTIYRRMGSEGR